MIFNQCVYFLHSRVTKTSENLFKPINYDHLKPWKSTFRFCSCEEANLDVPDILNCDTDLQQVCTESLNDANTVRCDLARRKRSLDQKYNFITRSKVVHQNTNYEVNNVDNIMQILFYIRCILLIYRL